MPKKTQNFKFGGAQDTQHFTCEKVGHWKKIAPIPNLTEDDEPKIYEDKYINYLSKASNGLDSVEMFEFKCEAVNFVGVVKGKLRKKLHFWNEIGANNAIVIQ